MVSGRLKLCLNSEGVSYALFYNSFYSHKIMRAVIQKVIHAKVDVLSEDSHETCGEINNGFMILLGVTHTDTEADAKYIADKTANLRIFEDENGKLNLSLKDVGGSILLVSQFTLTPMHAAAAAHLSPMLHPQNKRINFISTPHNFYANMA